MTSYIRAAMSVAAVLVLAGVLVVANGGDAGALKIHHIGTEALRDNSVQSSDIRDRTIRWRDLSVALRHRIEKIEKAVPAAGKNGAAGKDAAAPTLDEIVNAVLAELGVDDSEPTDEEPDACELPEPPAGEIDPCTGEPVPPDPDPTAR